PSEAKAGDYAKGVFERREPNLGLLLTGKRALRLDRGKPLEPQRFERFNGREGTLELWFKPNWSSAYSTGVRTLLDGDGWRIRLYPYNVAFQVDAANWKTGMWSGARACITSVGTWFDAGRWTHLAFQWHWSASGGQRFFLEVYVDGRLQNVGSALIRDVERDHIDNKYIQDGFPGTAAFAPKPISEQLTLGHGLDGVMDELRISDARRYPADFAPDRQSPFKPDAHTLALFHLDGSAKGERGTDGVPVAAELMGK
ncbi:MAG: LamG domain-containing protein, partial [Planctomycetes bacterium]|nr:LamG domain-containing protein [Planctomycetota bacterium]